VTLNSSAVLAQQPPPGFDEEFNAAYLIGQEAEDDKKIGDKDLHLDLYKDKPTVPEDLKKGDMARLHRIGFRILQIVDDENMLLNSRSELHSQRRQPDRLIWVKGFSTEGLADGMHVWLYEPVMLAGTKSYESGTGKRTVQLFKKLTPEDMKYLKESMQEQEKKTREANSFEIAKVDGTVLRVVFSKISKGKYVFRDIDGEEIVLALKDLDKDSQAKLQAIVKKIRQGK
jgi:hypothetical protein